MNNKKGNADKLFYLMKDVQGVLFFIHSHHPDLFYMLDLHRVWSDLHGISLQLQKLTSIPEDMEISFDLKL